MFSIVVMIVLSGQIHAEPAGLFLRSMQQPNGGFISDQLKEGETAKPNLRTTRTAIRAFRLLGLEVPQRELIVSFLKACYDPKSGGFAAVPGGQPDPISTSVALMIMQELKLPTAEHLPRALAFMNEQTKGFEEIRMVASSLEELAVTVPNAKKWEEETRSSMNPDGSFGKGLASARETSLRGVAIRRLGGKIDKQATLRALRAGQLADGGFGNGIEKSDLESCYRVVRLFHQLESLPNRVDELRGFIAKCKKDDGAYGRTPAEPSSLHGTYYATIITAWLEELQKQHSDAARKNWNFDDAAVGKLPEGWLAANTRMPSTAAWQVEKTDGGQVLVQTSAKGAYKQFNLAITDYRGINTDLSVRIKPRSGVLDSGGGIVWRYYDSRNYYMARWNPLENNLRVYKVVDGSRSQLDTVNVPPRDGWRTLRIVAYGRNIRGYMDGQLYVEAEDDQFIQPGSIGLWTKSDAVTEFDDLLVSPAFAESVQELPVPVRK